MQYVPGCLNRTAALLVSMSIGKDPIYLGKTFLVATVLERYCFGIEQHHVSGGAFYNPASGISVLLSSVLCFGQIFLHLSASYTSD